MVIRLDLTFLMFFYTAHAPADYISQCALRLSTPYGPIDFDVDVNNVNPDSRTTYANDVKISNFAAGTAAILDITIPIGPSSNFTRPISYVNDVKVLRRPGVRS